MRTHFSRPARKRPSHRAPVNCPKSAVGDAFFNHHHLSPSLLMLWMCIVHAACVCLMKLCPCCKHLELYLFYEAILDPYSWIRGLPLTSGTLLPLLWHFSYFTCSCSLTSFHRKAECPWVAGAFAASSPETALCSKCLTLKTNLPSHASLSLLNYLLPQASAGRLPSQEWSCTEEQIS